MEQYYNLLTKSAENALNTMTKEFSDRILSDAYSIAKQNNTSEEITLNDIQEAKRHFTERSVNNNSFISGMNSRYRVYGDTKNSQIRNSFNLRYERTKSIIYLFFIVSLAYLIFGSLFYLYGQYHNKLEEPDLVFLGIGVIGIF